mmetsp:Transcript_17688/g.56467  ORF Transcript_17688/g.56467 Transcript_17688/m.56467 type:complete len:273 (-) Transcript_17688:484-1302(-)
MAERRRHLAERVARAKAHRELEELKRINDPPRKLHRTGRERHEAPAALGLAHVDLKVSRALNMGAHLLLVRLEARVEHLLDRRLPQKERGHPPRILLRALDPDGQSFDASQEEPAVERGQPSPFGVLKESNLLGELFARDAGDAPGGIAGPAEELGHAVHHNVGAVVERLLQVRSHHRAVDGEQDIVAMEDLGERADVGDAHERVTWSFHVTHSHLAVLFDHRFHHVEVPGWHHAHIDPVQTGDPVDEAVHAAVDVAADEQSVAGAEEASDA